MESRKPISIALASLLFAGTAPSVFSAADSSTHGMDQPRTSERQAREIGLNRVPQGTVLTQRLEHRDGRSVWFLDIAGYNSRSRQEVLVDADSRRVLGSQARALTGPSRTATG